MYRARTLLKVLLVRVFRPGRAEDQIPAVIGQNTWGHGELVLGQERISERLLARAWDSGPQPIGVRNVDRANDVNVGHVGDMKRGENVRHGVERFEGLVNRDFEDRGRWIKSAIHDASAFAVTPGMRLCHCSRSTQSALGRGAKR